eukprot:GFKZ01000496.1.p1 GENE.GFKZ01000496.1~~GFKZ01000496.1.p1  ORF type:complete len:277 (+),score=26.35 GFKZ01000496.1:194-1024(+)
MFPCFLPPFLPRAPLRPAPHIKPRPYHSSPYRPSPKLNLSTPSTTSPTQPISNPSPAPLPSPSLLPHPQLPPHLRLHHLSRTLPILHFPPVLLLSHRLLSPLPLPPRLLLLSLLLLLPHLSQSHQKNLQQCSSLALRAYRRSKLISLRRQDNPSYPSERLLKPVRIHAVLTAVTAAGSLAGLWLAYLSPSAGAQVVSLFQALFYFLRPVRFENDRVYSCRGGEYRDVILAWSFASVCVAAVQCGWQGGGLAAAAVLLMALGFWVLKWIFVKDGDVD